MSTNEADRLVDFMARELIDVVRKECHHPDDPEMTPGELRETIRAWLNMRNLKKQLYAACKRHLAES